MSLESLLLAAALTAMGTLLIQRLSKIEKCIETLTRRIDLYLPPHP